MKKYDTIDTLKRLYVYAEKDAEKIAIVDHDGQRRIPYAAFYLMINSYALHMKKKGLQKGDMIAIELGRVAENHALRMACLFIGVKFVSVNPDYPADRKQLIYQVCAPSVIMDEQYVSLIPLIDAPCQIDETIDDEAEAYIDFTSGTTGIPKGILHDRSVFPLIAAGAGVFSSCGGVENYAALSDMMFAMAIGDFASVLIGITLHIISDETKRDPRRLKTYFTVQNINETTMLPSMLRMLAPFPTLRACITVGEKNDYDFSDLDMVVINFYGSSECDMLSYGYRGTDEGIGRTFTGTRVFLEDENGNVIDPKDTEKRGEFCYSGPGIMIRYLGDDALTRQAVKRDPVTGEKVFHTRDLGRYNTDGSISIFGRIDSMVKIRGNRVDKAEVEYFLLRCEGVLEAAVNTFEVRDENILCAFYTTRNKVPLEEAGIRKVLAEKLPSYMIPARIVFLEDFSRNPHGKIDRNALRLPEGNNENIAASDEAEQKISVIFSEILKRNDIGANDDFMAMGGTSLSLFRLQLELEDLFDTELDIREIACSGTPRKLAAMIRQSGMQSRKESTQPLKENEKLLPLTDTQYYMYFSEKRMLSYGDTGMMAYHSTLLFRIREASPEQIRSAVLDLVSAHPALSLRITEKDGKPYYVQGKPIEPEILLTELDAAPEPSFFESRYRPFHINGGELFRCEMFRHDTICWVILDIHHLLTDGYSMMILMRDFRKVLEGKRILSEKVSFTDILADRAKRSAEGERNRIRALVQASKPVCLPESETPDGLLPVYGKETLTLLLPDFAQKCREMNVSPASVFYVACMRAMCPENEPGKYYMSMLTLGRESSFLRTVGCLYRQVPMFYNSGIKTSMKEAALQAEQESTEMLSYDSFYEWFYEGDKGRNVIFNDLTGYDISAFMGNAKQNGNFEANRVAAPELNYANLPLEFEIIMPAASVFTVIISYDRSRYNLSDIRQLAAKIRKEILSF